MRAVLGNNEGQDSNLFGIKGIVKVFLPALANQMPFP